MMPVSVGFFRQRQDCSTDHEVRPSVRRYTLVVTITYAIEPNLSAQEFIDVLVRSTLGERRPIHQPQRIRTMLERADIVATARTDGLLVGVSRAISDFAYSPHRSQSDGAC